MNDNPLAYGYVDPISSVLNMIMFGFVAIVVLVFVVILLVAGGVSWLGTTLTGGTPATAPATAPVRETFKTVMPSQEHDARCAPFS